MVKCEKCGNEVEISPITVGKIAYFAQLLQNNVFYILDTLIDVDLPSDMVINEDDVNTKLKEIRIDCPNCKEYIVLNFD